MNCRTFCIMMFAVITSPIFSQDKSAVKFGKVSAADFDIPRNPIIDSSDGAVIIADIGSTTFVGNYKGWFNQLYKRSTRIKILNDNGFDLATVKIRLYTSSQSKENLKDLTATTYYIENGKVMSRTISKGDIYEEKLDKNHIEKRFTLPAVSTGCIIEYSYSIESDFDFHLRSWTFQSEQYPCLWSEYKVSVPELLSYAAINQGSDPFFLKEVTEERANYRVTEPPNSSAYGASGQELNVDTYNNIFRWAMKDMRPLKQQHFVSTVKNYVDKIDFQLRSWSNGQNVIMVRSTWQDIAKELLNTEYSEILNFSSSEHADWYANNVTAFIKNDSDTLQAAKQIYYRVQKLFNCTSHNGIFVNSKLNQILKNTSGSAAEINLLLTALLRTKGIDAEPLILSTRENGFMDLHYPVAEQANYVICKAIINGKILYMDASVRVLGFGTLPYECYNGYAREISFLHADSIYLSANSLQEQNVTSVLLVSNEQGVSGMYNSTFGTYGSIDLRKKLKEKSFAEFEKEFKLSGENVSMQNLSADSLDDPESTVSLKSNVSLPQYKEDIIYFKPVISSLFNSNPLSATARSYPIEMPYCFDNTYILDMEVPKGYKVEELPKQAKASLSRNDGSFEYLIQQNGNHIQLRCRTKLNKAIFSTNEYESLRNFFDLVVQKQAEQIVFKKI